MAQALVPLKDLVQAKTRLAGLLSPSERRALTQAMIEDVLGVLADSALVEEITLVSDDPAAYLLAARFGATHWPERDLGCRGLNAVIQAASARLLADRREPLLVLHGDLPLLTGSDISSALEARRKCGGLVVGCDRHVTGTNLLCFDAASAPRFSFGADSCDRHLAAASDRGVPATLLRAAGIGLDVDEPEDLGLLLDGLDVSNASQTAKFLRGTGLDARIGLALASLGQTDDRAGREGIC